MPLAQRRIGPTLGHDGAIPSAYVLKVRMAIVAAWKLNEDKNFVKIFRETVAKLTGRAVKSDAYAAALNKMVINHAETSNNTLVRAELAGDERAKRQSALYQSPPAFSIKDGKDIWIRTFRLEKGDVRNLTADIMHEAAHLAGAPNHEFAEIILERIHNAAGLPR